MAAEVQVDLIGPTVLDKAESVRKSVIDFRAYANSNLISEADLGVLLEFQRTSNSSRVDFLESKGLQFFTALLSIYIKIVGSGVSNIIAAATALKLNLTELFFSAFDRQDKDPYFLHLSARMLTRLISAGKTLPPRELRVFSQWLASTVQTGEPGNTELALAGIQKLLGRSNLRQDLLAIVDQALVSVLTLENRVQAQYQAVFSLWELSFDPQVVAQLADSPAVLRVGALLRTVRKEKLARVCVAFLRNLLEKIESSDDKRKLATTMISQKVLQSADGFLKQKTFQDEEVVADCEFLVPQLTQYLEGMSSFEEYRAEVLSGQLEWSPVHRSERFWRDNINNINDKHGELVKALARYLETAPTFEILAIAVHDLGQYVRFYPRGKKLLESLGAKVAIVNLMEHPDPAVRYEALVATQKILTQNWEFLGQKLAKGEKSSE